MDAVLALACRTMKEASAPPKPDWRMDHDFTGRARDYLDAVAENIRNAATGERYRAYRDGALCCAWICKGNHMPEELVRQFLVEAGVAAVGNGRRREVTRVVADGLAVGTHQPHSRGDS